MVDATFDDVNLRIILPAGESQIDVERDLYSAWKRHRLNGPERRRAPQAFRTVGGDPLTPGLDAGAYFFLQNQNGWRIRPAEETRTVTMVGNLVPEDSTLELIVPTLGAFTVLILGLQPVTQGAEDILSVVQSIEIDVALIKSIEAGNVVITGSGPFTVDVFDYDTGLTLVARFTVSADGKTRTRLI